MAALVAVDSSATLSEPLQPAQVVAAFEKLESSKLSCPCPRSELDDFLKLVITPDPLALDRLSSADVMEKARSTSARSSLAPGQLHQTRALPETEVQRVVRVWNIFALAAGTLV